MGLTSLRVKTDAQRAEIMERKMKRAQETAQAVINSDTFKAQLAAVPDVDAVVDEVAKAVCTAVTDPVVDFEAVMNARGFNDAIIRKIVRNLATAFNLCDPNDPNVLHEDRLKAVAEWAVENPWVYDSLETYR